MVRCRSSVCLYADCVLCGVLGIVLYLESCCIIVDFRYIFHLKTESKTYVTLNFFIGRAEVAKKRRARNTVSFEKGPVTVANAQEIPKPEIVLKFQ